MEKPAKPKPAPPPLSKPPPPPLPNAQATVAPSPPPLPTQSTGVVAPPKPVKNVGTTVPVQDAIKRMTVSADSPYAPVKSSSPGPVSQNPFAEDANDEEPPSPVVHRNNPLRSTSPASSNSNSRISVNNIPYSADAMENGSTHNSEMERHQSNVLSRESTNSGGPESLSKSSLSGRSSSTTTKRKRSDGSPKNQYKLSYAAMGAGEPNNQIYHKVRMSVTFLAFAFLFHVGKYLNVVLL